MPSTATGLESNNVTTPTRLPAAPTEATSAALAGCWDAFISKMVAFAESDARQVRVDHRLFLDLFRTHRLRSL